MQKSITLRAFPSTMTTLERVEMARAAGYDGVEVNLEPNEEYNLESSEQALTGLRNEIEARGLRVSSIYSRQQWHFPITSQAPEVRQNGMRIIEHLARVAPWLGTDTVLVVPGAVDNRIFVEPPEIVPYGLAYQSALSALQALARTAAERYQVCLAIENVWNKFLLSPLEFAAFLDAVGSSQVRAFFDVGNVMRTGFPEHWIPILGARIQRVHFKDFRLASNTTDGFVALQEGDVNWPAVMAALRSTGYRSWVIAEVLPYPGYDGERLIYKTSASMDRILSNGMLDGQPSHEPPRMDGHAA